MIVLPWLEQAWALIQLPLLAGAVGVLWGFSEIIGKFNIETPQALRTGGGWLLLVVNFIAAALCFAVVAAFVPAANNWGAAIIAGLAWPTVIRNTSFKLGQPLDGEQSHAAVRFEQVYASIQGLCLMMINKVVTRRRMELMADLMQLDVKTLEQHARQSLIMSALSLNGAPSSVPGSTTEPQSRADAYVDMIMGLEADNAVKKAMLVATVVNRFGPDTLKHLLKQERARKRNAT
jgi:hypothetical protein